MTDMDNIPLVSVIVPTYNQSQYLSVCLDSILFQDYPNIEIIVVNDASTDNTAMVLEYFNQNMTEEHTSFACHYNEETGQVERCRHPRYPQVGRVLHIIHHQENRGLGAALNTGIRATTGELCTFIASDDMFLPSALSEMVMVLTHQSMDFVYADMHIIDDTGRILRRFSLPDYHFENVFCRWYLCGICKLYRRKLHEKCGYYHEHIKPQDHEMYLRFAMHGARFVHLAKVLANVRIHGNKRKVDNHLPANWSQLYHESAALVLKARRHLRKDGNN